MTTTRYLNKKPRADWEFRLEYPSVWVYLCHHDTSSSCPLATRGPEFLSSVISASSTEFMHKKLFYSFFKRNCVQLNTSSSFSHPFSLACVCQHSISIHILRHLPQSGNLHKVIQSESTYSETKKQIFSSEARVTGEKWQYIHKISHIYFFYTVSHTAFFCLFFFLRGGVFVVFVIW